MNSRVGAVILYVVRFERGSWRKHVASLKLFEPVAAGAAEVDECALISLPLVTPEPRE